MSVTVGDIVAYLKELAPLSLKESWDNPGLLVGNPEEPVQKVMTTLDVMKEGVAYAVAQGVQLIVSHHPIIMKGVKALRTDTYDGQLYQQLLSHHIAVYCAHTNLDSARGGVNDVLAERLQLQHTTVFIPGWEDALYKIVVYVPHTHAVQLRSVLGKAGAGYIGKYRDCSFSVSGQGRFTPQDGTHPFIGMPGKAETVAEERIETIVPGSRLSAVIETMVAAHPYEEPAYDIYPLKNEGEKLGLGRVGMLPKPLSGTEALHRVKEALGVQTLAFAGNTEVMVRKVAVLGGSGADFISQAKAAGAQLYVTGDVKYHVAQEAIKAGILLADGGHYGTESPVVPVLCRQLEQAAKERGWQLECLIDPTSRDMIQHLR
ncbi:dinuclear metal center protein, YbgI family [Veillonellaceae bacterium DNF00751]|nr:dinuclear metal center protein, YbgI family [Veillonellaceae bacterium DNF00751]